ncbi:putative ankyrin repeat protein [Chloropicon roscoffensis]|uniref:Ankyrin repeat protein n=1 Tax=Chloropicon roscoffensis TaxID=1461544 RepID=A0AAX4PDB5_9CHLO
MARAEGEPSTKRAKVDETDEAKEEEDPLVRRKEEVVRLLGRARKGKDNARAKEELVTLCADLQAKNEKHFRRLPPELWQKILDENVQQNDLLALAMTCRFFREKQKDLGWKMETDLKYDSLLKLRKSGKVVSHSLGWFRWVCDTLKALPGWGEPGFTISRVKGTVHKGVLLNYALFQGSVEISRWLVEEKGCKLNGWTNFWAGMGGSVDVLEYMERKGLKFDMETCTGAATGGCLEALKFLRSQDPPRTGYELDYQAAAGGGHLEVLKWLRRSEDPPCPWSDQTCRDAAEGGHLEVLKWLRDQDPPCPWDEEVCAGAAFKGHLDVLKWARAQDPPCPWGESICTYAAMGGYLEILKWLRAQDPPCRWRRSYCRQHASIYGHQHVVEWIDQQEDESDAEYLEFSDSDRSYDSYSDEHF